MIRVVIVDDHPALRAGLQTVLDSEPGIVFAGESSGEEETCGRCSSASSPTWSCSTTTCRAVTGCSSATASSSRSRRPRVIIFSAYASPELMLPRSSLTPTG